jgi:hypothetical protein
MAGEAGGKGARLAEAGSGSGMRDLDLARAAVHNIMYTEHTTHLLCLARVNRTSPAAPIAAAASGLSLLWLPRVARESSAGVAFLPYSLS